MTPPAFAYFGSPAFAAKVLAGLLDQDWLPSLVVTEPAKPVGRAQTLQATAVEQFATTQGLNVVTPPTIDELAQSLTELKWDLFVVAAYGKILPPSLLALPIDGAINVHASLLPRWRGASPIQATILAGDKKTGITFMQMDEGLDTGPILTQHQLNLNGTEETPMLTDQLATLAAAKIVPALTQYLEGDKQPAAQPETGITITKKLSKNDGQIQLATITAKKLDQTMRALQPWPGVFTTEFGERLLLKSGRLKENKYILTSLQWAGKLPVDGKTFSSAYPKVLTHLPKDVTLGAN